MAQESDHMDLHKKGEFYQEHLEDKTLLIKRGKLNYEFEREVFHNVMEAIELFTQAMFDHYSMAIWEDEKWRKK